MDSDERRLEVSNITFGYDERPILKDISFAANAGELIFLLGPNGIGKTTLFRCILGFLKGYSGNISIDGRDIRKIPARELAKQIAYIPQAHNSTFGYSVLDMVLMGDVHNISIFSSPGEKSQLKAMDILEHLGIKELAYKCFSKLSGGEQQLVLIARALMQSAKLLLMDEPTSNLDYGNQLRLLQKIKQLSGEDYIILLSSHNPQHALTFADRVLAINDGSILADGNPSEVLDKDLFRKLYKTEVNFIDTTEGRIIAPIARSMNSMINESEENHTPATAKSRFEWNDDMIYFMESASRNSNYYRDLAKILSKYISPESHVCDAGCGLGYLSIALADYCKHVTAIDISKKALNHFENEKNKNNDKVKSENNNFHNITVECADIFKLSDTWESNHSPEEKFDCMIFCFFGSTLESIDIARKLCKPGGRVILIKKDWYVHRFSLSERTINHYTLEETLKELQEAGINAQLERIELEFGQPLKSLDEAVKFYRTYSHDSNPENITKEAIAARLEEREDDEFPYYLPQKKVMGVFVTDM